MVLGGNMGRYCHADIPDAISGSRRTPYAAALFAFGAAKSCSLVIFTPRPRRPVRMIATTVTIDCDQAFRLIATTHSMAQNSATC